MKCWELLFSSLIGRDFRELVYLTKWFADELWVFAKIFDTILGIFHVLYPLVVGPGHEARDHVLSESRRLCQVDMMWIGVLR